MSDILNVSIAGNIKGRTKNTRVVSEQWPRLYEKGVESIKDKNWELRNYVPKVESL